LAQRGAAAPDRKVAPVLLRLVHLVHQTWQHVPVVDGEVIVRPKDVGRHHRGPFAAVLVGVTSVLHVDHPLGVGVARVGRVRRSVVDHGLVDGIPAGVGRRDELAGWDGPVR
jgi:hypothetical protein